VDSAAVTGVGEEAVAEGLEAALAVTEEDVAVVEALLEAGEAVTVVDEVVDVDGEHPVADEVEQLAAQREEPAPRSSSSPTDTLAFS